MLRSSRSCSCLRTSSLTIGCRHTKCAFLHTQLAPIPGRNSRTRRWQPELSISSLLSSQPTPAPTTLAFTRAGLGGRVVGYSEVRLSI
jgi:hypothetical protein